MTPNVFKNKSGIDKLIFSDTQLSPSQLEDFSLIPLLSYLLIEKKEISMEILPVTVTTFQDSKFFFPERESVEKQIASTILMEWEENDLTFKIPPDFNPIYCYFLFQGTWNEYLGKISFLGILTFPKERDKPVFKLFKAEVHVDMDIA